MFFVKLLQNCFTFKTWIFASVWHNNVGRDVHIDIDELRRNLLVQILLTIEVMMSVIKGCL